ncbi:MAG: LPS export ABC transporter periplasmic protein LptC [Bacteroidota bacterium]
MHNRFNSLIFAFTMYRLLYAFPILVLLFSSCTKPPEDLSKIRIYTGPVVTAHDIITTYTDSGALVVEMHAPLQTEYNDGDREFPQGILVNFYNEQHVLSSRLTARYARFDRATEIYIGTGDVVIENFLEHKKVNTEELRWNRSDKRVFTDKFVRITTPDGLLTGTGLTAAQDFSTYRILKPETQTDNSKNDIL